MIVTSKRFKRTSHDYRKHNQWYYFSLLQCERWWWKPHQTYCSLATLLGIWFLRSILCEQLWSRWSDHEKAITTNTKGKWTRPWNGLKVFAIQSVITTCADYLGTGSVSSRHSLPEQHTKQYIVFTHLAYEAGDVTKECHPLTHSLLHNRSYASDDELDRNPVTKPNVSCHCHALYIHKKINFNTA